MITASGNILRMIAMWLFCFHVISVNPGKNLELNCYEAPFNNQTLFVLEEILDENPTVP
jgi:hypothetical protein